MSMMREGQGGRERERVGGRSLQMSMMREEGREGERKSGRSLL